MKRETDSGPYALTLYLECVVSLLRILPSFIPSAFLFGFGGVFFAFGLRVIGVLEAGELDPWIDQNIMPLVVLGAVMIAFSPVVFSVLTLTVLPGGYGLTAKELDAREPNDEEREILLGVQRQILAQAPEGTIGPSRWLVLNKPDQNAFVLGTTIYIHWGLIDSEYLAPVLAHELGHLNHGDGRRMLALRRFIPPPLSYIPMERVGCLALPLMAFGGGAGLMAMTPLWNRHWQRREFLADRFAYECGQAVGLIEFLELYEFFDVAVPFGFLRRSHPHSAERTNELNRYLREEPDPAGARFERTGSRLPSAPISGSSTPEMTQQSGKVIRGYTDAEAFLDLVVLDFDHPGSDDPRRIVTEQTWIKANGRRIVDLAQAGAAEQGAGIVWIWWYMNIAPESQYDDEKFMYEDAEYYSDVMDNQELRTRFRLDREMCRRWEKIIETNDPEQSVAILIHSVNGESERHYANHYLVGMRDGGPLPVGGKRGRSGHEIGPEA